MKAERGLNRRDVTQERRELGRCFQLPSRYFVTGLNYMMVVTSLAILNRSPAGYPSLDFLDCPNRGRHILRGKMLKTA